MGLINVFEYFLRDWTQYPSYDLYSKANGEKYLNCDNDHYLEGRKPSGARDHISIYFWFDCLLQHDKIEKIRLKDLWSKIKFRKVKNLIEKEDLSIGDVYEKIKEEGLTPLNFDFFHCFLLTKCLLLHKKWEGESILFLGTRGVQMCKHCDAEVVVFGLKMVDGKLEYQRFRFKDKILPDSYVAIMA